MVKTIIIFALSLMAIAGLVSTSLAERTEVAELARGVTMLGTK